MPVYLAGLFVLLLLTYTWRKGKKEVEALLVWSKASDEFKDWRYRNQGVYVGLSPEGIKLVRATLEAYDRFLKSTSWFEEHEGYRDWLLSFFDDLPPKYPASKPVMKKGVPADALSI